MKKLSTIILLIGIILCFSACDNSTHNDIITNAITELENTWETNYQNANINTDKYFEIKSTRIISIKENDIDEFNNVNYVVEFVLFTNYFDTAPYYSCLGQWDCVIVYENGDMEVPRKNIFSNYSTMNFDYDYSNIIDEITEYKDKNLIMSIGKYHK